MAEQVDLQGLRGSVSGPRKCSFPFSRPKSEISPLRFQRVGAMTAVKRDLQRETAWILRLSMISSENRFPLFGIMP